MGGGVAENAFYVCIAQKERAGRWVAACDDGHRIDFLSARTSLIVGNAGRDIDRCTSPLN